MKAVSKVWGSELWIVNNDLYCGKMLTLTKGWQGSKHYHKRKTETFYVLTGFIRLELDSLVLFLSYGSSVTIPPRTLHRFAGMENSQIIEFSTTHDDDDTYREIESGPLQEII